MRAIIVTFVAEVVSARRANLDISLSKLRANTESIFGTIATLHFACVVVFDTPGLAPLLVLEQNFDGDLDTYLKDLVGAAATDLHAILQCCVGYAAALPADHGQIISFLRAHAILPCAYHVGNVGRQQKRIRAERDLHQTVAARVDTSLRDGARPESAGAAYTLIRAEMRDAGTYDWVTHPHVRQTPAERLLPWVRLGGVVVFALIGIGSVGWVAAQTAATTTGAWLCFFAALVLPAALLLSLLRWRERTDVPMDPATLDAKDLYRLTAQEDRQFQNHLASITVVKPGRLRHMILRAVLFVANLVARTSTKGKLSGIPSIHFAHWALVDGGRRLMFLSNYDGSWGSYLDDFVEKASTGLTAIWSNTMGFPRTRFLVLDGARDGTAFKAFARMSQAPAAVWYSAYPNLTVEQIDASSGFREGLATSPRTAELCAWLRRV